MNSKGEAWAASPLTFYPHAAPESEIEDAPSVYICVNTAWASFIMGRLRVLTRNEAWQGDDTERWRATQNIERLLNLMACEDCSEFVTDIRVNTNGQLQTKKGGAWGNANGDGGDITVINNKSTLVENNYPPEETDAGLTAEERACNIASGFSEWLYNKFNDVLDAIEATSDLIAAADVITAVFPPLYVIVNAIDSLINEVVEAGINNLRNAFDTDAREKLLCAIYCLLEEDGFVDQSNIIELNFAMTDSFEYFLLAGAFGAFQLTIDNNAMIQRAMMYQSIGSAENCGLLCIDGCAECRPLIAGEVEFSPSNPRFWIKRGTYNSADNSIDADANGELELWFSLVRDLEDVTEASSIPRACPFEAVGTFTYERSNDAGFVNLLFTGQNFPFGSNSLSNFAGQQQASGWTVYQFMETDTYDRAAIQVEMSIGAGNSIRLRNFRFSVQAAT